MSAITVGRIGEYIAAAVLEMYQWQTVIAPQAGFDIIVSRGQRMCVAKSKQAHFIPIGRISFNGILALAAINGSPQ